MRTPLILLLAVLGACGTARPSTQARPDWISVSVVGAIDLIGHTHIQNTLSLEGIPNAVEGSVMYGVRVPPRKAELARAIVRADARSATWDGDRPWKEIRLGVPFSDPKARAIDPAVSAVLKEERARRAAEETPTLTVVRHRLRPYRGRDGDLHDGHEIEIHLEGAAGTQRLEYQTLEDGESVTLMGRHSTGFAGGR